MDHQKLFILLQLTDSAFPTGGFSHSMGLEAFTQYSSTSPGHLDTSALHHALICILENSGSMGIPFVQAAYKAITSKCDTGGPEGKNRGVAVDVLELGQQDNTGLCGEPGESGVWVEVGSEAGVTQPQPSVDARSLVLLDKLCEACMANHIARRASIRQGRSLLETCVSTFSEVLTSGLEQVVKELPHCHQAVVHGALMASVGLDSSTAVSSFMFGVVRTLVATAVRLDVVGATAGQKLQCKLQNIAADVILRNKDRSVDEACIKFPVVDILQNTQDTLFAKLFYS